MLLRTNPLGKRQSSSDPESASAGKLAEGYLTSEAPLEDMAAEPAPEPGTADEARAAEDQSSSPEENSPVVRPGEEPADGNALLQLLRQPQQKGGECCLELRPRTATGCSSISTSSGGPACSSSGDSTESSSEDQHETEHEKSFSSLFAGPFSHLWEQLARPIVDARHAKAFVGCEVFSSSMSRTPNGPRPQVLVDRRSDRNIMAMFKPSGWATCSTPAWEGNEGNLIRHVWQYYDAPTAAPCHRLDKGTSGIVLVGTSKEASKHICQQILHKSLVKQYVGLCHGIVKPAAGAFSAPLALSKADRPLGTCSTVGREAVTRYRVLGYFQGQTGTGYSLVQVQIDHGRQHQIRLHMASLGHPVVADSRYNSSKAKEDAIFCPRLFLHACYLRCTLHSTGLLSPEPFAVACHLPPELKAVLLSELSMARDLSADLTVEAQQLCECLLSEETPSLGSRGRGPRPERGDLQELHASRLAMRKRDEFLKRFGFTAQERVEVIGILNRLPTSKERSAALLQFRVLGQRSSDFIVGRFEKYVDGLVRLQQTNSKISEEEPVAAQAPVCSKESCCDHDGQNPFFQVQEAQLSVQSTEATGPVRILTEEVWCDVCGFDEKQVTLHASWLCLRLRQPGSHGTMPPVNPVRRRRQVREITRSWAPAKSGCRGCSMQEAIEEEEDEEDKDEEDEEEDESDDEEEDEEDEEEEDEEEEDWEEDWAEAEEELSPTRTPRRWMSKSGSTSSTEVAEPSSSSSRERSQKAKQLEQTVHELIAGNDGSVDGVWLAGKVSEPFNLYVRENNKRNDGGFKRWLLSLPGIRIEHDAVQKNHWRVIFE